MFKDNMLKYRYGNSINESVKSMSFRKNPFSYPSEGVNNEGSIDSFGSQMSFDLEGVDVDHFYRPLADSERTSTVEDLTLAARTCKQRILAMVDDPEGRQKLIDRLIELNTALHAAKEARQFGGAPPGVEEGSLIEVAGHRLVRSRRESLLSVRHCEACGGIVKVPWKVLCCSECDVHVHGNQKCLQAFHRPCPASGPSDDPMFQSPLGRRRRFSSIASISNPGYNIDIDSYPLPGDLTAQKFLCVECSNPLGPVSICPNNTDVESLTRSAPRFCHYYRKFFCTRCHWGNRHLIPSVYFLLNRWSKMSVSRSAFIKLKYLWDRALFRMPRFWQQQHQSVEAVLVIRRRLFLLRVFVNECASLRLALQSRPLWLLEQPFLVTMAFVEAIDNGSALETVQILYSDCTTHIPHCETCQSLCQPCNLCQEPSKISLVSGSVWACGRCGLACVHEKCALDRSLEKSEYVCHNCSKTS